MYLNQIFSINFQCNVVYIKNCCIFALNLIKTHIMVGIEKFENELSIAKENLKYAKDLMYIIDFWNKRELFEYTSIGGDSVRLFGNEKTFYNCGAFNSILICYVNSFISRYETAYDVSHENKKELVLLSKHLKKFSLLYKNDSYRFWGIAQFLDSEIK